MLHIANIIPSNNGLYDKYMSEGQGDYKPSITEINNRSGKLRRYTVTGAAAVGLLGITGAVAGCESGQSAIELKMDKVQQPPDIVIKGERSVLKVSIPTEPSLSVGGVLVSAGPGEQPIGLTAIPGNKLNSELDIGGVAPEVRGVTPEQSALDPTEQAETPVIVGLSLPTTESQYVPPVTLAPAGEDSTGTPVFANYWNKDGGGQTAGGEIFGRAQDGDLLVLMYGQQNPEFSGIPIQNYGELGAPVVDNQGRLIGITRVGATEDVYQTEKAFNLHIVTSDPKLQRTNSMYPPFYIVLDVAPVNKFSPFKTAFRNPKLTAQNIPSARPHGKNY